MKPLLPLMTLEEAADAMTDRTAESWTARDILGAAARGEFTLHAKIPHGMKMIRCDPMENETNEVDIVAGVLFPLDFVTVKKLLVGPDVEVTELHGPKRIFPDIDVYGTALEWVIADGEAAPTVTPGDCWVISECLNRLIGAHEKQVPNNAGSEKPEPPAVTTDKVKKWDVADSWEQQARAIGQGWMLEQRKLLKEADWPGVEAIAKHVEGELSTREITGKRGKYLDWETIKREALTGITERKAKGKK